MRDPKTTSKIMSAIRSKGTRVELRFAKALRCKGIKYRRHYKIVGKPDFVILDKKCAIFVDGDFWHGNGWKIRGFKKLEDSIKRRKRFWLQKIKRNIARDKKVNRELRKNGWRVLRFWESQIQKDIDSCAQKTVKYIQACN